MLRVFLLLLLGTTAAAQTWSEEVNHAIDRGVHHLLCQQREDGSFRHRHGAVYATGETALATYALLKSGLTIDDPAIQRAIKFLLKNEKLKHVYNVSTYIMALDASGASQYDEHIRRAAAFIEKAVDTDSYLWSYPNLHANKVDLSNTQFALLGLHVASKHGFKPNRSLWLKVFQAVAETQNKDGGFGYRGDLRPHSSGAMTTAGLTVAHLVDRVLGKKKTPRIIADVRDRAWTWMDKVFTVRGNPSRANGVIEHEYPQSKTHPYYNLYYLYGLERVAAFAGRRDIGERDWYREGALFLLKHQQANGGWRGIDNTAFALLFLKRATFSGLTGIDPKSGLAAPVKWKASFKDSAPKDWMKPGFDDGPWQDAWGAVGTAGATNAAVRTWWKTDHVRLRRTFEFTGEKDFELFVLHDDGCTIWINGIKAVGLPYYTSGKYIKPKLSDAARKSIKKGKNLIAVHCENIGGEGAVDVRLMDLGLRTERADLSTEEKSRLWWKHPPHPSVPFLERWLVLGPIPDPEDNLLFESLLPDEKSAPSPGSRSPKGKWREHWARGGFVDFAEELKAKNKSVYYAFSWLEAKKDTKAVLRFGGDDGFQVRLDGKLILSHHGKSAASPDETAIPVNLRKGKHRLLIKVGNGSGTSGFFCRLTDREGRVPKDIVPRLKEKGADLEDAVRAHPAFFDEEYMLGQLEPDKTPKLDFRVARQLDRVVVEGSPRRYPQWRSAGKKGTYQDPPAGARGVAGFRWHNNKTVKLIRRLQLPGGKPKLHVRAAFTAPWAPAAKAAAGKSAPPRKIDRSATARIRIGVWRRGQWTWLMEQALSPATGDKKPWKSLEAPLRRFAGRDVMVAVEISGSPNGVVWLDDCTLKTR